MIKDELTEIQYNYKTKMVDELMGLTEKIALLSEKLYSDDSKIEKEKRELMHKQLEYMYAYRGVLMDRIYMELQ